MKLLKPILFKFALNQMGETHVQAEAAPFDGVRDAIILGLTPQSVPLARQLKAHHWQVRIAALDNEKMQKRLALLDESVDVQLLPTFSAETLASLEAAQADSFILMLSDAENLAVCELIYEHFGTETVVVHSKDRKLRGAFQKLGALIVEPETAVVSLLEQFVRAPSAFFAAAGHRAPARNCGCSAAQPGFGWHYAARAAPTAGCPHFVCAAWAANIGLAWAHPAKIKR
ncbi:MAG: NAD-binding protein [Ardenticatenaceae bacterium]|nr:NAD-binding protein [Ardenticatenaceae bacterium]